jgi:hypothetical protein
MSGFEVDGNGVYAAASLLYPNGRAARQLKWLRAIITSVLAHQRQHARLSLVAHRLW